MARRKSGVAIDGWLVIDKPEGMSSAAVVGKVRRLTNARKAGHAGTLDPMATGVLPIALGEATKTVDNVMNGGKRYEFTVRWGAETTTDDREGDVVATPAMSAPIGRRSRPSCPASLARSNRCRRPIRH